MAESGPNTLPVSRVRTIMKSSPDVSQIGADALWLTGKAAEVFVQYLAMNAYEGKQSDPRNLTYDDLANYVQDNEDLEFLHEIIPRKMRMSEVYAILAASKPSSD